MKLRKPAIFDSPEVSGSGVPPDRAALKQQFVKNVQQRIFVDFLGRKIYTEWLYNRMTGAVARETKSPWSADKNLAAYIGNNFDTCIQAVEACHEVLASISYAPYAAEFDKILLDLIQECCQDLNLRWEKGRFI
jgi:hypothetical protein